MEAADQHRAAGAPHAQQQPEQAETAAATPPTAAAAAAPPAVFGQGGAEAHALVRKKTVEEIWRELNARKSAAPLSRTTGVAGFGIPGVQTTTRTLPSRSGGGSRAAASVPALPAAAALAAAASAALAAVRGPPAGAASSPQQQQHSVGETAAAAGGGGGLATATSGAKEGADVAAAAASYARAVSALSDQADRAARLTGLRHLRAALGLPLAALDRDDEEEEDWDADDDDKDDAAGLPPPPPPPAPLLRLLLSPPPGAPPALPALVGTLADGSERCRSEAAGLLTDAARRLPAQEDSGCAMLLRAVAPALAARMPGAALLLRSSAAATGAGEGWPSPSSPEAMDVDGGGQEGQEQSSVAEEPAEEVRLQLARMALVLVGRMSRRRRRQGGGAVPLSSLAAASAANADAASAADAGSLQSLAGVAARAVHDPFPELKKAGCALVAALARCPAVAGGGGGGEKKKSGAPAAGPALAALVLAGCAPHQHSRVRAAAVRALDALARAPPLHPLALAAGDVEALLAPGLAALAADRSPAVRAAAHGAVGGWMSAARALGADPERRAAALAPLLLLGCSDEQPDLAARCVSLLAACFVGGGGAGGGAAVAAAPGPAVVAAAGLGEPYASFFSSGGGAAADADASACCRGVRALLPSLLPRVALQLGNWTSSARLAAARELHAAVALSWGLVGADEERGGGGGGAGGGGGVDGPALLLPLSSSSCSSTPGEQRALLQRHRAAALAVAAVVRAAADDERDPAVLLWLRRAASALAALAPPRAWLPLALDALCGGAESSALMASLAPSAFVRGRLAGGAVRAPGVLTAGTRGGGDDDEGGGGGAPASPATAASATRRGAALQMLAVGLAAAHAAGQALDLQLAWAVAAALASEDVRALALGGGAAAAAGAAAGADQEDGGIAGAAQTTKPPSAAAFSSSAAAGPGSGPPPPPASQVAAQRALAEAARAGLLESAASLLRWARPLLEPRLGVEGGGGVGGGGGGPAAGSAAATAEALYLTLLQVREAERDAGAAAAAGSSTAAADAALAELAACCRCCCFGGGGGDGNGDGNSNGNGNRGTAASFSSPSAALCARFGPALMSRLLSGRRAWDARSPGFRAAGALLLAADPPTLLGPGSSSSGKEEQEEEEKGLFASFARRAAAPLLSLDAAAAGACPELRLATLALLDELLERQQQQQQAGQRGAAAADAAAPSCWPARDARLLVASLLLPPLVWRAGKVAAAARFGAVTALATALARGVVPDEVWRELCSGGGGGGGGGGKEEEKKGGSSGSNGSGCKRPRPLLLLPLLYGALDEEWYADVRRTACYCARKLAERAGPSLRGQDARALADALVRRLDDGRAAVRAAAAAALEAVSRACFGDRGAEGAAAGSGALLDPAPLSDADAARLAAALALHMDDGAEVGEERHVEGAAMVAAGARPPPLAVAEACALALESLAAARPAAVREELQRARPRIVMPRAAAEVDRILSAFDSPVTG